MLWKKEIEAVFFRDYQVKCSNLLFWTLQLLKKEPPLNCSNDQVQGKV